MKKIFIALIIGVVAGILDVIPMIIMKISWYACAASFVHWLCMGLIIPFINWQIPKWLTGLIVAEFSALSIVILNLEYDPRSVLPILVFSAILGILVGIAGKNFVVS